MILKITRGRRDAREQSAALPRVPACGKRQIAPSANDTLFKSLRSLRIIFYDRKLQNFFEMKEGGARTDSAFAVILCL